MQVGQPHIAWSVRRAPCDILFATALCLAVSACSSTAQTGPIRNEDPRGTVVLEAFSDHSIQASHPINLEPALIGRVLRGLQTLERQRALQEMLAGSSSATPVFAEDQVQFLAPRIANALTAATAGEHVAFSVTDLSTGTTAGSLYAYGLSLYVTLSQYRVGLGRANQDSTALRRLPDSSGLSTRSVLFTPSAAQRPESFLSPTTGTSASRTIAVDYLQLQQASQSRRAAGENPSAAGGVTAPGHGSRPEPGPAESQAHSTGELDAPHEADIKTLKDLVIKKDLEVEALKTELQSLRQQLDSQAARRESQKRKPLAPSRSPRIDP